MSTKRPAEHPAQTPANGHEANGQFAKGNKGGPGNPFARQVAQLRKVIINRLTEEDLLAITEALLAKAKQGNVGAAKLLLAYGIGKPASSPDPDRLDGQELEHFKEKVEAVQEVHELAKEAELGLDVRPKPHGTSEDLSALVRELVRSSEKYDNPACVGALVRILQNADSGDGARPAWQPPSVNGPFGLLPARIQELAQSVLVVDHRHQTDLRLTEQELAAD